MRLAVAALIWTSVLLAAAVLTADGVAPPVSLPSATQSLEVEHGRMPARDVTDLRSGADAELTRVAYALARIGTVVQCWSAADWRRQTTESTDWVLRSLGPWRAYTSPATYVIHLSPEVCAELRALRRGAPIRAGAASDAAAWSVAALAHEAQHVSGVLDEARADCYGLQTIAKAAGLLGRTALEGRYLAAVYAKHWYPWHKAPYRSADCRDGGALDLRPRVATWP